MSCCQPTRLAICSRVHFKSVLLDRRVMMRPCGYDRPLQVEPPCSSVPLPMSFEEKYARHCVRIQQTIDERRALSERIKADNARIQAERRSRKQEPKGGTRRKEEQSDEEPARHPMTCKHKCKACNKPFSEWRLGQSECELCQLHRGWNKGFRTNQERAAEKANQAAQTVVAAPPTPPKATPSAKPAC